VTTKDQRDEQTFPCARCAEMFAESEEWEWDKGGCPFGTYWMRPMADATWWSEMATRWCGPTAKED
jgi:hypothetical protein